MCCYITLDPDQLATLYQKNQAIMSLYNTGSLSAGDFIPEEPGLHDAIYGSVGEFIPQDPGPACCYITLDLDQQATLNQKNRISMMSCNTGS